MLGKSGRFATAALVIAAGWSIAEARADAVADFYRGKTIKLVVPASAGGVYGTFGLMMQQHFPRHIPGNPKVVLQFMAGAGGTKAANYVYNAAPKDGTTLATLISGVSTTPVLRPDRVKYDPNKLNWLGGWGEAVSVLSVYHTAPIKTLEAARKPGLILGAIGKATATYQLPALLNTMLGTKFKMITGYRGGSPIRLAIEKGEVHGWAGLWLGWRARKPEWVRDNKLVHLVQLASKRSPDLPDTPLLTEFARTDDQRRIFEFVSHAGITSWTLSAPPGVPADRLAAIEKAYAALLHDPAFLADAKKRHYPIDPISAKDIRATVKRLTSLSPRLVQKARAAMGFK